MAFGKKSSTKKLKLCVFIFCIFMASSSPRPAHAGIDFVQAAHWVTGFAHTLVHDAAEAIHWAAEVAQWLIDNMLKSSIAMGAHIDLKIESKKADHRAQAAIDGNKLATKTGVQAAAAAKTVVPAASLACATAVLAQQVALAKDAGESAGQAMNQQLDRKNTGPNADASAPAAAAEDLKDLCALGFLNDDPKGENGTAVQSMGCHPDPDYIDADRRISSVLKPLQYPLPQNGHVKLSPSNHILFAGATGDEKKYVAAYKYCESISPKFPTPPHTSGSSVNVSDVVGMVEARRMSAAREGQTNACAQALHYRMACPANSGDSLKMVGGAGGNCHERQKAVCLTLKAPPPHGYGLTFSNGDPEIAYALANCEDQGFSDAMYDAAMANICQDTNYIATLGNIYGDARGVEHFSQSECKKMASDFRAFLENKAAQVHDQATRYDSIMRGPSNTPTQRAVGP